MKATQVITKDQFEALFNQYIENHAKDTKLDLNNYDFRRAAENGVMRTIIMHFISDQDRTEVMLNLGMIKREYQVVEFTETDAISGRTIFSTDSKYRAETFAQQYGEEMQVKTTVTEIITGL